MRQLLFALILCLGIPFMASSQILDTSNNPFGLVKGDSEEAQSARTAQYLTYGTTALGYLITGGSFAVESIPGQDFTWKNAMLYSGVALNVVGPASGLVFLGENRSAFQGMLIRTAGITAMLGGAGIIGPRFTTFKDDLTNGILEPVSQEEILIRAGIFVLGTSIVAWSWTVDTNKIRSYPQRMGRSSRENDVFFSAGPTILPKGHNNSTLGIQMRLSF